MDFRPETDVTIFIYSWVFCIFSFIYFHFPVCSHLKYTLHGTGNELFRLHPDNGYLTTIGKLDRETRDTFSLIAKAEDGGGLFCQADVVITVTDVNDNPPRFNRPQYTVTIPENAQVTNPTIGLAS